MIQETELSSLLFFDLETSAEYGTFQELLEKNPRKADLWIQKHKKSEIKDPEGWSGGFDATYPKWAPLNAEFGRIVCGSFAYVVTASEDGKMAWKGKMKSFYDTEASETSEKEQVLEPIFQMLNNIDRAGKNMRLCGHNIKNFDIPWLVKRMIINEVEIPPQLRVWGKKPWELTHLDTAELWSLGSWGNYTSLDLLSCSLGVPSPKEDLKGEYVGETFWIEKNYEKIKNYCEEDVKCGARVCHKLTSSILPLEI